METALGKKLPVGARRMIGEEPPDGVYKQAQLKSPFIRADK